MMDANNTLNGINLAELGIKPHENKQKAGLGQQDFMKLLMTQLKNQDPLQPQENGEFISQMTQFAQLDGINKINNTFDTMQHSFQSSAALQASSLVGREVMLSSEHGYVSEKNGLSGNIKLPVSADDVSVSIYDDAGKLVKNEFIGIARKGKIPFQWDGKDSGGTFIKEGIYRIEAKATIDGKSTQLATDLGLKVNSVSLTPQGGIKLNIESRGEIDLAEVSEFK